MNGRDFILEIKENEPNIDSVFFVGCGASKAELYPGNYLIKQNATKLSVFHYTANEFYHDTPKKLTNKSIVITCSHGGTTEETCNAALMAKNLGAKVIAVTNDKDSLLAKNSNYVVTYNWFSESYEKCEKMGSVLGLAFEILAAFEDYAHYDEAKEGFEKIYDLIKEAVNMSKTNALNFANDFKDEELIYVMGSGPTSDVAYSYAICLLMEMQWINSNGINSGEYFHGPFEITDEKVPFILLMNEGKTRALDKRALEFLNRFASKFVVIDSLDFGLGAKIGKNVYEYFNPMLITGVLREYAEQLAIARKHPLTQRRYMWKLEKY